MRAPKLGVWIVIAFVVGLLSPIVVAAQDADLTCDDFTTQDGAQYVFDLGVDRDIEDALDPDGDGVACDDLPARNGEEEEEDEPTTIGLPRRTDDDDPGEDDPADEPSSESSRPLDGRLGSPRDSFEDEWGEPVSDDAGEYPLGFDYDIDGFGNVNVFYHRDYVAYITLDAERRASWTMREADQVVEDFLPSDVELDRETETDDGEPLTPAHSEALETRFGEGTYERYGASGEQGDLFYVYRLDADGDVETIEIGLGDDIQEPVADEPADDPADEPADEEQTPEDIAYLETIRPQFDALAESMDEFDEVVSGFGDGSIEPGDAGARFRVIFDSWRQADLDAQAITPPATSEGTHELYLEFTGLLAAAADDYTNGLLNADDTLLTAGDEKYGQARVLRLLLGAVLIAPDE